MKSKKQSTGLMMLFVIGMILFIVALGMLFYKEYFVKNSDDIKESTVEEKESQ